MGNIHTTACGTEPFDKTYCLGYQVHHEDWSPYPRINKLRQNFLDRGYDIDVERLRLVTESYKAHPNAPQKLQAAYAFAHVLENCGIYIYDDDLIVGDIASPVKSAPIYPEFSVNWIIDEIEHHPFEEREHDQFYIRNDSERQEILDLCRWWQGRTLDDYINTRLDDDQLKGSEAGKKIFQTNLYHYAGTGHLAIDYWAPCPASAAAWPSSSATTKPAVPPNILNSSAKAVWKALPPPNPATTPWSARL